MNHSKTNGLMQVWIEVADESGRTHLESRWLDASIVN